MNKVSKVLFVKTKKTCNDVIHVVLLDLRRNIDVDLNSPLGILLLDSVEERVEPFCDAEVTNNPSEIDLHSNLAVYIHRSY